MSCSQDMIFFIWGLPYSHPYHSYRRVGIQVSPLCSVTTAQH